MLRFSPLYSHITTKRQFIHNNRERRKHYELPIRTHPRTIQPHQKSIQKKGRIKKGMNTNVYQNNLNTNNNRINIKLK